MTSEDQSPQMSSGAVSSIINQEEYVLKMHRPFEYERVYLPLCEVADTPFHIQLDDMYLP